jgi:hypothetical protein
MREEVIKRFYESYVKRFDARKQIRVSREEFEPLIVKVFAMIQYFNSLEEDTTFVLGRDHDQVLVPVEFKDLVWPMSIRFEAGKREFVDLLPQRPVVLDEKNIPSYRDYMDAIARLRGIFKKGAMDDLVKLSDIRKHVSVADVFNRMEFEKKVHYDGIPFLPLNMKIAPNFANSWYFNTDSFEVVDDYVRNLF